MKTDSYLFPVYEEGSDTAAFFFVNPAVVLPAIVGFGAGDRYGRKGHFTQYLAVPLDVPNYLMLCHVPGQISFSVRDEIAPSSFQVLSLIVSLKVNGVERHFSVNTESFASNGFIRSPEDQSVWNLDLQVRNLGGTSAENRAGEKVGWDIFTEILAAGYEPMLNIDLAGSYDRQRNRLRLNSVCGAVRALRNIENNDAIFETAATQEQMDLMASVKEIRVVGVRMHQLLEDPVELPAGLVDSFTATETPSPMAKKFEEVVKGSGYWQEATAEYRPYDSFDLERNVPLALAGNPNVILPEITGGVWLVNHQVMVGTYKTPYPGTNPKRYQAFVVTPKENIVPHYPITSAEDVEVRRSDDERYFTSLKDTITCYVEANKRGLPVHEIAAEFNGRTAQEMIDYFKPFDAEPRGTFPIFPSDSVE